MANLRLFVAAEISKEVRSGLEDLIKSLSAPGDGVKWVRPASIHLTMKFLGNVKEEELDKVIKAGETALSDISGIDGIKLSIEGLGKFPGGKRIRVIWIGLKGELDRLEMVQDALNESFYQMGFPKEERDFRPHLTLGRVKGRVSREIIEKIEDMKDIVLGDIRVSGLHLLKSDLRPTGAVYTSLAYYSFE